VPDSLNFTIRLTVFFVIHSLLAAPGIKARICKITKRQMPGYRLLYNLLSMALFSWVILAWHSASVIFVAPGIWSLVMHGLQFIIICTAFICLKQTGLSSFMGTDFNKTEEKQLFKTSGCYSVVRHPLYLLGILFMLLNPVITTRWLVLTLFSIPYLIFGAILEERRMISQLGDKFQQYQRDVPFLIPKPIRHICK